jgi:hypothetical protein
MVGMFYLSRACALYVNSRQPRNNGLWSGKEVNQGPFL